MKQTCILILGMHRSGTSALSGTLGLLDVYLGSELMKPVEQNAKGFYENILLYKLNEKLLQQIGSSWDDAFYNESKINPLPETLELEKVIEQEFKYCQLFAIKDPRLAYLFPVYIKALTNLDIEIKIIIPFRNPLEVADSLKKRNHFSQEKGLLLWAYHFLLSEKLSRGIPRVFTTFDDLVESPHKVIELIDQKLDQNLLEKYPQKQNDIYDFLTPGLKHHNIALNNLSEKVPNIIRNIIKLVPDLNEKVLTEKLDGLRSQLFEYQSLFYNSDITKSLSGLEQAEQELQAKDKELEQSKQELQAKDKELEQSKQELQAKDKELVQELQAKDKELDQAKQELQAKDKELEHVKDELISMYLSKSWKLMRPLRKAKRFFRLKK